jgi:hypothetical protein
MSRPRASILGLIAAVVACGVAFAALRSGSDYWLSAFYTLTVALLLWAVLAARYRRGTSRAFWFGFAVFGWGMFLLGHNAWVTQLQNFDQGLGPNLNSNLLSTRIIHFAVLHIRMGTDDLEEIDRISENTVGIVNLMFVIAVAFVGGFLAVAMKKRGRRVTSVDPSRRSNVVPSVVILIGLSFAGLGALDRPTSAEFIGVDAIFDEYYTGRYAVGPPGYWNASGEPSLWGNSQRESGKTAYRFLWIPSFDHPLSVWIVRSEGVASLRVIVLDGLGGYEQGRVAIDRTVKLNETQWKELESHLERSNFWEMPTRLPDDSGSDGDTCVVEGVSNGRYHLVDRWEPDPGYESLCRYMLELTGLKAMKAWEGYHSHASP